MLTLHVFDEIAPTYTMAVPNVSRANAFWYEQRAHRVAGITRAYVTNEHGTIVRHLPVAYLISTRI